MDLKHASEWFTGAAWYRHVTVVLIITGTLLQITLFGLLVHWKNIRTRNQTQAHSTPTMCVPQSVIPDSDRHDTDVAVPTSIKMITIHNDTNYCGDADQVLKWLSEVNMVILMKLGRYPNYNFYDEIVPETCKLTSRTETVVKLDALDKGYTACKQNKTTNSVAKIYWKKGHDGYIRGDIGYQAEDGEVVIKNPGLYFVSTQINIEVKETFYQLTHYLYKRRTDESVVKMMENKKQHCDPVTSSPSNLTSSFGAVFIFNKDDRVFVATSSPELLVPGPSTNNFIVYAV